MKDGGEYTMPNNYRTPLAVLLSAVLIVGIAGCGTQPPESGSRDAGRTDMTKHPWNEAVERAWRARTGPEDEITSIDVVLGPQSEMVWRVAYVSNDRFRIQPDDGTELVAVDGRIAFFNAQTGEDLTSTMRD